MHGHKMICDSKTGVCGLADYDQDVTYTNLNHDKIQLYYFTDPICAHCYALEPVIKKFRYVFSEYVDCNVVLGGLLDNWENFFPCKESTVAQDIYKNWQEVAKKSILPIDGFFWPSKPLTSSYPVSKVYEVIEQLNANKANLFLRLARIQLLSFNKRIDEADVLREIIESIGLNANQILQSAAEQGMELLQQDLDATKKFRVQGFPTVILVNPENKGIKLVGQKSLCDYQRALQRLSEHHPILIPAEMPSIQTLLDDMDILFYSEIAYYYDISIEMVPKMIEEQLVPEAYTAFNQTYIQKNKARE